MKKTLILGAVVLAGVGAQAAGVANTEVTGLVDDLKATFDAVLPIALTVLGTFMAIGIGKRAWARVS